MNEEQLKELTQTTERSRSNTHRIDKLEEQQTLLHEMNKNIAVIAEQTKDTKEDLQGVKKDVEEIKQKPNKLVDHVQFIVIGAIAGAVVGAMLGLIL